MRPLFIQPYKNLLLLLLIQFLGMSGVNSLLRAQDIRYDLDCAGGPGQAQMTVISPLGGEWSYALDDDDFQATNVFSEVFPGNHWLFVRNSSGTLDSVRFNANCGLEPFSCNDCDETGTFFQVYTENGSIAGLSLETNQFSNLPNSPAGFHINAIGMSPSDSLGYGMRRRNSTDLIVVDGQGTAINLGPVENLPSGDYVAGDFDANGYLHIKEGLSNELFKIDVKEGKMVERYLLDRSIRTTDIAYNIVENLFYSVDNNGNLWSFSPIEKEFVLIGSSFLSGPVGAMYCDRSGRVFGIQNSSGRLYQFDLMDGSANFIMVTSSASFNDGFSCQNIYFINIPPPVVEVGCSSDSDRVDITIVEPPGNDLEFRVNSSTFQNRRDWSDLPPGQTEIVVRREGSCLSDTVNLDLMPIFSTQSAQVIEACDEFISPSGTRLTNSGNYRDTIPNSMGCDSIIEIDLTILEGAESMQSVEACDEYISPSGIQWDESGVFKDTIPSANGCDSVLTFDITILESVESTQFIEACNEYIDPNGRSWTQSGSFSDTLLSAAGCDSILTYDITILQRSDSTLNVDACDEFISPNGDRWSQSGVFRDTLLNSVGCDSILTYDITILQSSESTQTVEACDEFISPTGQRWLQSGTFYDTLLNSSGCDSVLTYNLTILESSESTQAAESCDPFLWNGTLLDSSGTYEYLATNQLGCDSIARLNFTLRPTLDTQINVTSCRPYTSPDGMEVWEETGVYIDTILSSLDCDSIITVNFSIEDLSAEWQISDPECPDRFLSGLQIDTITHQAPHYLLRNGLDSISISSLPVEITDLPPGEHEIQFVSADSCKSPVSTIQIEELILPEIQLVGPPEVDICDPPTLFQVETNISGSVQWYSNSSLQCDTCRSTEAFSFQQGPIGVEFTGDNNCTATAEIDLKVTGLDAQYFIPNVFSPNGDGINDYFTLFTGRGEVDQIELLEIYDRWGNLLFEQRGITPSVESQGWDGWYRGRPMPTGVYVYRIIYRYCDGSTYRLNGSVTIVR